MERCSCGARRRPLRRLAQRGLRAVLAGFSYTGLSHTGATAEQLNVVVRVSRRSSQVPSATNLLRGRQMTYAPAHDLAQLDERMNGIRIRAGQDARTP